MDTQHLLDNTVVIITSDHGEAFGEHEFWQHEHTLYGEVLRVPLYVKRARQERGEVSHQRLNGADVYYLAFRELGLEVEDAPHDGAVIAEWYRSAERAASDKRWPVDIDRDLVAWIDGTVKWIVGSKGTVEAYDLATDPQELHNLAVSREQIERAQARAASWWAAHPPLAAQKQPGRELDPSVRERLRNLGYLE